MVRHHAHASVSVHARAPEANLVVAADPVALLGVVTMKSLGGVVAGKQSGALRLPAGDSERKRQRGPFGSLMTRSRDYFVGKSLKLESWRGGGVPAVCFLRFETFSAYTHSSWGSLKMSYHLRGTRTH